MQVAGCGGLNGYACGHPEMGRPASYAAEKKTALQK